MTLERPVHERCPEVLGGRLLLAQLRELLGVGVAADGCAVVLVRCAVFSRWSVSLVRRVPALGASPPPFPCPALIFRLEPERHEISSEADTADGADTGGGDGLTSSAARDRRECALTLVEKVLAIPRALLGGSTWARWAL
jgi:hypothetical protein